MGKPLDYEELDHRIACLINERAEGLVSNGNSKHGLEATKAAILAAVIVDLSAEKAERLERKVKYVLGA